jgi:hypothetical protein
LQLIDIGLIDSGKTQEKETNFIPLSKDPSGGNFDMEDKSDSPLTKMNNFDLCVLSDEIKGALGNLQGTKF